MLDPGYVQHWIRKICRADPHPWRRTSWIAMSGERSQDEGERAAESLSRTDTRRHMSYHEKLKLGSFCHIDDRRYGEA